jgi:hypothetical protein
VEEVWQRQAQENEMAMEKVLHQAQHPSTEKVGRLNAMGERLMHLDGTLGRAAARSSPVPARMMLDSGSSHCFIAPSVARQVGGRLDRRKAFNVRVANGEECCTKGCLTLQVTLGTWQAPKLFWVLDISMDVVLGLDFLERFDPHIGWKDRIVTLRDAQGHSHQVEGVSERELASDGGALNLLSKKEVRRCLRDEKTEYTVFWMAKVSNSPRSMDRRVKRLLDRYRDVFPDELPKQLPPERAFNHEIDTGDAPPVNLSAYSLSQEKLTELRRQVTELVDKGLIQVSASPWGFPVIFVKKPGGEWRMCIDYRALNEITRKNGYPLPRIQELIDLVGRAKYLTKIDLASGYWQVRVGQGSIPKTAFNTIWGKFEWKAMPFGLCNAPATFQTMMNETLRGLLGECVLVYLDDILVFSDSLDKHLEDLE